GGKHQTPQQSQEPGDDGLVSALNQVSEPEEDRVKQGAQPRRSQPLCKPTDDEGPLDLLPDSAAEESHGHEQNQISRAAHQLLQDVLFAAVETRKQMAKARLEEIDPQKNKGG